MIYAVCINKAYYLLGCVAVRSACQLASQLVRLGRQNESVSVPTVALRIEHRRIRPSTERSSSGQLVNVASKNHPFFRIQCVAPGLAPERFRRRLLALKNTWRVVSARNTACDENRDNKDESANSCPPNGETCRCHLQAAAISLSSEIIALPLGAVSWLFSSLLLCCCRCRCFVRSPSPRGSTD